MTPEDRELANTLALLGSVKGNINVSSRRLDDINQEIETAICFQDEIDKGIIESKAELAKTNLLIEQGKQKLESDKANFEQEVSIWTKYQRSREEAVSLAEKKLEDDRVAMDVEQEAFRSNMTELLSRKAMLEAEVSDIETVLEQKNKVIEEILELEARKAKQENDASVALEQLNSELEKVNREITRKKKEVSKLDTKIKDRNLSLAGEKEGLVVERERLDRWAKDLQILATRYRTLYKQKFGIETNI